jgi:hypothetical protein
MGEQRAIRESIVGNQANGIYLGIDDQSPAVDNIVCLHSFFADKLIYVHNNALGYNKCKFNTIPEAALMFKSKSINGEMSHAC